ncbi:hypothetical protein G6F54_013934 [Rhizopus delemar]|nr:hypothetical protein G6F54_013934 [Rhizopus delemar]
MQGGQFRQHGHAGARAAAVMQRVIDAQRLCAPRHGADRRENGCADRGPAGAGRVSRCRGPRPNRRARRFPAERRCAGGRRPPGRRKASIAGTGRCRRIRCRYARPAPSAAAPCRRARPASA